MTTPQAPDIKVDGLSYAFPDGSSGLRDVVLSLPPGSRTLLIGGWSNRSLPKTLIFVETLAELLTFLPSERRR